MTMFVPSSTFVWTAYAYQTQARTKLLVEITLFIHCVRTGMIMIGLQNLQKPLANPGELRKVHPTFGGRVQASLPPSPDERALHLPLMVRCAVLIRRVQ